jgi:hypothetical protein
MKNVLNVLGDGLLLLAIRIQLNPANILFQILEGDEQTYRE